MGIARIWILASLSPSMRTLIDAWLLNCIQRDRKQGLFCAIVVLNNCRSRKCLFLLKESEKNDVTQIQASIHEEHMLGQNKIDLSSHFNFLTALIWICVASKSASRIRLEFLRGSELTNQNANGGIGNEVVGISNRLKSSSPIPMRSIWLRHWSTWKRNRDGPSVCSSQEATRWKEWRMEGVFQNTFEHLKKGAWTSRGVTRSLKKFQKITRKIRNP